MSSWWSSRSTPDSQPSWTLGRAWYSFCELWYSNGSITSLGCFALGTSTCSVAGAIHRRYWPLRFQSAEYVTPDAYSGRWLKGYVTAYVLAPSLLLHYNLIVLPSVGDADGFRFCHAPGRRGFNDLSDDEKSERFLSSIRNRLILHWRSDYVNSISWYRCA